MTARAEHPVDLTWNLEDIYPNWDAWDAGRRELDARIDEYAALKGTLAEGPDRLLAAMRLSDALGQLAYKVYLYAMLTFDEDQRNNDANARRQQVHAILARWQQATSWMNPELLGIPHATVNGWMADRADLALYRFAIDEVYRLQEHVLDEKGETLMSLSSRLSSAPDDAYSALSTADAKFPEVTLSTGDVARMSYAQYRAVLATNRHQDDRRKAFEAHYGTFAGALNTYAALYHGVCQRDWFHARARGYQSTPRCSATTSRRRSCARSSPRRATVWLRCADITRSDAGCSVSISTIRSISRFRSSRGTAVTTIDR